MLSRAKDKLKDKSYSREKLRWNFKKYIKTHVDQHAILTGLVKHRYSGIDDRSKVRHLMDSIKTKVLDPVKTQIMASAALRNDFDACVNLYKDFIEQSGYLGVRDANILLVQSDRNGVTVKVVALEDQAPIMTILSLTIVSLTAITLVKSIKL